MQTIEARAQIGDFQGFQIYLQTSQSCARWRLVSLSSYMETFQPSAALADLQGSRSLCRTCKPVSIGIDLILINRNRLGSLSRAWSCARIMCVRDYRSSVKVETYQPLTSQVDFSTFGRWGTFVLWACRRLAVVRSCVGDSSALRAWQTFRRDFGRDFFGLTSTCRLLHIPIRKRRAEAT